MLQSKTQMRRRSVTALTLMFALCAASIVPAAAAPSTNTLLPVITSVQLDLPSAGKITINGIGFGSGRPSVTMGGTPPVVDDGYSNTKVVASLPVPLPAAGDYLLVMRNASSRLFGVLTVTIGATGPQGPPGAQGSQGAPGPQGPAGAGQRGCSRSTRAEGRQG